MFLFHLAPSHLESCNFVYIKNKICPTKGSSFSLNLKKFYRTLFVNLLVPPQLIAFLQRIVLGKVNKNIIYRIKCLQFVNYNVLDSLCMQ